MYFPKSQIQTGFFSNNDLVISETKSLYVGPYFKTSDGRSYSGKEPNKVSIIPLTFSSVLTTYFI